MIVKVETIKLAVAGKLILSEHEPAIVIVLIALLHHPGYLVIGDTQILVIA
jgi:hypothetical protein